MKFILILIFFMIYIYVIDCKCVLVKDHRTSIPFSNISLSQESLPNQLNFNIRVYYKDQIYMFNNVTHMTKDIGNLHIEDTIIITWRNLTNMDTVNQYFSLWTLYIGNMLIKPISMRMNQFLYVSYIEDQCEIDTYDITSYPMYRNPNAPWYVIKIFLDWTRMFKSIPIY